jgi:hypothetical protein
VIAVTIERGGFGADSAAPAASQILSAYLGTKAGGAPPVSAAAPAAGSYD